MIREIEVGTAEADRRLDRLIADLIPDVSRSLIQRLIYEGRVSVNNHASKPAERVHAGDRISIEMRLPPALSAEPEPIDLNVVYADKSMAIIDKPAGLVVHPAAGHAGGTLVNGLVARFPHLQRAHEVRPGLVHRLDKDTSGLMVVALTAGAQANLAMQVKNRSVKREYKALAAGHFEHERFIIDVPVGRDPSTRRRMAAGPHAIAAREARTHVMGSEDAGAFSFVRLRLETGRTHQIRVHLAYIGHPVAADTLYGGPSLYGLDRQFLHAARLELVSPLTGSSMSFDSPLPPDLERALFAVRSSETITLSEN